MTTFSGSPVGYDSFGVVAAALLTFRLFVSWATKAIRDMKYNSASALYLRVSSCFICLYSDVDKGFAAGRCSSLRGTIQSGINVQNHSA